MCNSECALGCMCTKYFQYALTIQYNCQMGGYIFDRKHNYEHEQLNRIEEIPVPPCPCIEVATPSAYGIWSAMHVQGEA